MAERRGHDSSALRERVDAIAEALREGTFDPQHAGSLFLREGAAKAILEGLHGSVDVAVGIDGKADLPGARFMGMRVVPGVVVYPLGGAPRPAQASAPLDLFDVRPRASREEVTGAIAVTITILRQDARPVQAAIADAVILASRYDAVVVLVLDRRMARRDPFGRSERDDGSAPSPGDRGLVDALARDHGISLVVRRQDPFGFA
jgi:hypothetical protein